MSGLIAMETEEYLAIRATKGSRKKLGQILDTCIFAICEE